MLTELSQRLREYLDSNKEGFADYIHQTDLYHPDGTINEITVQNAAQFHIEMLRDFISAEMMLELRRHLERCLSLLDFYAAAVFLCLFFVPFTGQLPLHSLRLTADEQMFRLHIEQLEALLKN